MSKRILVSPLDWGLGHATRCIPIIKHLLDKGLEVIIACDGLPLALLKEEFPNLEYVEIKGYHVKYSSLLPASAAVALQIPKIKKAIAREHKQLEQIIKDKKIDAVISDNRYGLWTDKVPCIIITHQLNIQAPLAKDKLRAMALEYIKKFSTCWIPDYKDGDTLSAVLSHPIPDGVNATYLGLLSRFEPNTQRKEMQRDLLVLLSGPEPQRTILEKKAINQVKEIGNLKALIVRGIPDGKKIDGGENIEVVSHLNKEELLEKILTSKAILARPGYSTLMDLAAIGGKRAILIPTPGQTEQEYLAMYMESENIATISLQKNFSLREAWRKVFQTKGFNSALYRPIYKEAIDEWLAKNNL